MMIGGALDSGNELESGCGALKPADAPSRLPSSTTALDSDRPSCDLTSPHFTIAPASRCRRCCCSSASQLPLTISPRPQRLGSRLRRPRATPVRPAPSLCRARRPAQPLDLTTRSRHTHPSLLPDTSTPTPHRRAPSHHHRWHHPIILFRRLRRTSHRTFVEAVCELHARPT